jgi:hypothetical protein
MFLLAFHLPGAFNGQFKSSVLGYLGVTEFHHSGELPPNSLMRASTSALVRKTLAWVSAACAGAFAVVSNTAVTVRVAKQHWVAFLIRDS